ncbi:coiled coil domain containing protein 96 [Echinococcus multilocularis]|uniref:Coiled coil domain containing protein 96 n=1 Tax=Echinococcus multilocularis TaxID=6211 RepID=A0A068Y9A5_ECHMU|nr:coiled coil domain containing protein 96 [Echinococcus multilocularis]
MNIKDRPLENTPQKVVGGHEAILDGMGPKHSPNKEQPDTLLQNDPEDDKRDESENKMVDRTEGEHLLEKNDIRRGGPPTENDLPPRIGKINGSGVVEVVTPTTLEDHNDENELKKLDYEPLVSGSDNNDDSTDKTNFTTVTSAATLDSAYECRREELLERHKALLELRHKAGHLNMQLQTTLSEHFRRRRVEGGDTAHSNIDSMTSSLIDTGIDYTSRYAKYMETLAQVRSQFLEQKERLEQEISSLKELSNHKSNNATNKQAELAEFLLGQGKKAISSRTGRPLPTEHYKSLIETWQRKTATVAIERLENLKLQREVEKINAAFKAYDLSESLHLIDFEQMKIENQTYNEKIEERNEETSKLRRKITNMVQMITHANEKLQFCQAENSQLKDQLNLWAEKSSNGRDTLTKLKQVRDALRANHAALVRACGLLGRPEMLRGYEQSVNDVELKKHEISNMKQLTQKLQVKAKVYEDKFSHERRQH